MNVKNSLVAAVAAVMFCIAPLAADTIVTPSLSSADYGGFMNVSELDGTFSFGSGWGIDHPVTGNGNDIGAFEGDQMCMRNSTIDVADDAFWFQDNGDGTFGGPGGIGNKIMEANLFQEFAEGSTGPLAGMDLIYEFEIPKFTLTGDVVMEAFIKEFDPGFANPVETSLAITGPGSFSISQAITGAGGAVQYGFRTVSTVAWITDADNNGCGCFAPAVAVPEPTALALLGLAGLGMISRRRR